MSTYQEQVQAINLECFSNIKKNSNLAVILDQAGKAYEKIYAFNIQHGYVKGSNFDHKLVYYLAEWIKNNINNNSLQYLNQQVLATRITNQILDYYRLKDKMCMDKNQGMLMFANHYEQERLAVIDIFNQYIKCRALFRDIGVNVGLNDVEIECIQHEVEKLKENNFLLLVVGESCSGKSCFINALLGKYILPIGVLQCTAGIIEIIDTDNNQDKQRVYLNVIYNHTSESKLEFYGHSDRDLTPLREKLNTLAAIKEEYRSLPIFQLNQFLIEKNPERITCELIIELTDNLLKDEKNNPHMLSREEFEELVWKYLADYRDLSKIPIEISMGFPLGFKFSHIQIVDTPGINARGGLEAATLKYMTKANAAIIIHPLKNIASSSLSKFLNKIPKRILNNSFMCLTQKAYQTDDEVNITIIETKKLFPDIKEERIVAVDSMLKLIHDELKTGISLADLMKDEEKKKLLSVFYIDYNGDKTKIQDALLEASNINIVKDLLLAFIRYTLKGQLQSIIDSVAKGNEVQQQFYNKQMAISSSTANNLFQVFPISGIINLILLQQSLGEQFRLPSDRIYEFSKKNEEFKYEINKLKNLLDAYRQRCNDFSHSQNEKCF